MLFTLLLLLLLVLPRPTSTQPLNISIPLHQQPLNTVRPEFISFTLDAEHLTESSPFRFAQVPHLANLTRPLSPCFLRIGGTTGDMLWYNTSSTSSSPPNPGYSHTLQRGTWDAVLDFLDSVDGMRLVFGLNAGPGPRNNTLNAPWRGDNAAALLEYTVKRLGTSPPRLFAVELGNEPNLFGFHFGLEWLGFSPEVLGRDIATLRTMLDGLGLQDVRTVAPDVAFQIPVLTQGLVDMYEPVLRAAAEAQSPPDIVSWHWYPLLSSKYHLSWWLATDERMRLKSTLDSIKQAPVLPTVLDVAAKYAPKSEVWLGETGGASGGGQNNVSNAFADVFWWADELGLLAASHAVVARQDIVGGFYNLVDDSPSAPQANPDYWVALLHKQLMGVRVLNVTYTGGLSSDSRFQARAYSHCSSASDGAPVLLLINPTNSSVPVHNATASNGAFPAPLESYVLTSGSGELSSPDVRLNDELLQLDAGGNPPKLRPRTILRDSVLDMPPLSVSFVRIGGATAQPCVQ